MLLASVVINLDLYAIKVLRSHSMCVDALKEIYRAYTGQVTICFSSLVGFSPPHPINNASKHSSVEVFGSACIESSDPTPTQLAEDADERLFRSIKYSEHQVLQQFLPELNSHSYTVFDLDAITSSWPQKLTNVTL